MDAATESCVACGRVLTGGESRRHKRPSHVARLCREEWAETPLAWEQVRRVCAVTPEREGGFALCMACVHWAHRVGQRRQGRVLLPLDAVLLFLHFPFSCPAPDQRLARRMVGTLLSTVEFGGTLYHNPYVRLLPEGAEAVLRGHAGGAFCYRRLLREVALAYWEANSSTLLLGTREEMKRVRQLVPVERLESLFLALDGEAGETPAEGGAHV